MCMGMCGDALCERACRIRAPGYSLIEVIIASCILALLLFAVGDAVTATLRAVALSGGRASAVRTISELATRMSEEARSSSAVFIPANDVFGKPNGGASAHEVDFFRRLSAGGDSYVAYSFDAGTGTVTRYEYSLAGSGLAIAHADPAASGVAVFAPVRFAASSMTDVVDAASVSDVSVLYGVAGAAGGNDVVTVSVQAAASGGVTPPTVAVHLASRAAPTTLSVLAPANTPPAPGPVQVIPFVIRNAPVHAPHGPWHFGSPGDPGDGSTSELHSIAIPGQVQFFGPGSGLSWFDLFSIAPVAESGTYTWIDATGERVTATVSCEHIACPKFRPLPTSGSPAPPNGGVGFNALP